MNPKSSDVPTVFIADPRLFSLPCLAMLQQTMSCTTYLVTSLQLFRSSRTKHPTLNLFFCCFSNHGWRRTSRKLVFVITRQWMWKTRTVTRKRNIKKDKQEEREEKDSEWIKSEKGIIHNINTLTAIVDEIHEIMRDNFTVFVELSSPIKSYLKGQHSFYYDWSKIAIKLVFFSVDSGKTWREHLI